MLHVDDIYCINMLLKDLHDTGFRFGRVLMIFTGDVRQIMPIVKNADPLSDRQAQASFFFSADCAACTRVTLTDNMRVRQSADHANFLAWQELIGYDRYEHVQFPQDRQRRHTRYIRVPSCFARFDEDAFIAEVYDREVLGGDPVRLANRVILAATNSVVDRVNRRITAMMPADRPSQTYLSVNTPDAYDVYDPTSAILATDNLQSIVSADIPVHELTLRVGMPIMCMQNLDVSNGICNGTTMIVERLDSSIVWCRVNTRYGQRLHPIAPTKFIYNSNGFKFSRTQLPLRVAFCVTINRAQAGTYDFVGYHATYPIWAHGMLFVAVTRVTTPEGLTILCNPNLMVDAPGGNGDVTGSTVRHATMRNIVHPWVSGRAEQVSTQPPTQPAIQPQRTPDVVDEEDPESSYGGPEFAFYDQPNRREPES
jgi:ATP-dependent DNA helicase PIF1